MSDESGTEVMGTLKARLMLAAYAEPGSPSDVARKPQLPANTVHYWTRKLVAGGLLAQVGQDGRIRTYQSREAREQCEPEACAPFVRNVMQAIDRVVMNAAERYDLSEHRDPGDLPQIGVHELRLSAAEIARLVESLKAAMPDPNVPPAEDGDPHVISFIVAPGRLSEHM